MATNHAKANCPLCNSECHLYRLARERINEYECPICGHYAISDFVDKNSLVRRAEMHFYLLHKRRNDENTILFVKDVAKISEPRAFLVDEKMLDTLLPKTLNDKIDMVMLNLSTRIKSLGERFVLDWTGEQQESFYSFFWVDDSYSDEGFSDQIGAMIEILQEYDYLSEGLTLGDNMVSYTFTAKGWNHIGDLQKMNKAIFQAFIAMWFDPQMKDARDCIIRAITDSGYVSVIIDEKEHNNQIVPEIFYEIQRSTFVIADLTEHRNGVYYEAGYAQALGKEVIITCRSDSFKERHFDVAQKNMICWDDENDLYRRLMNRIEATVGKRTTMN